MMGTIIQITVVGEESPDRLAAVEAAFAEMRRVEALLSEWQPDSEISRINAAAGKRAVAVSEETFRVVRAGLEVSRWSDGAFDMSWAALRGLYNFKPGQEKVPTKGELAERLPLIDYRAIELNARRKTVHLKRAGMQLGTGGIGKGYALDRAAQLLKDAKVGSFMIFGGGQIQLHGKKGNRPWRVGVQHPRRNDYFAFLEAESGSVSTSGDYERAFMHEGKRIHHLIDPRTGQPAAEASSVTVIAEQGLYADAVSTAIFIMGAERALKLADTAPGGAQFLLLDEEQRVHTTPDMVDLLRFKTQLVQGRVP
ncbi:MAG: FAD:protein FMN transferase [Myxococcales bacterium]|nr:FAD:protein FMN transferase [Myxococcales bacterium]